MKVNTRSVINRVSLTGLIVSCIFLIFAGSAAAAPGDIPEIGKLNTSSNSTADSITGNLGIFSELGEWILEYAVYIAIFVFALAIVILLARGSWARSRNKLEEAVDTQRNQQGLIVDGVLAMAALMFVFFVLAPFVKEFI